MKNHLQLMAFIAIITFSFMSCERNTADIATPQSPNNFTQPISSTARETNEINSCNPDAYTVTLESHNQVGNEWEWVWSVQNSNPGNGSNGTVQNLSHWGMQLAPCVDFSTITAAAYSDDGINWISFTPTYQVDPSQSCMTAPVLKFDFGTSGSNKSYYRITVNAEYVPSLSSAYYKSGRNTGCCTFSFTGFWCEEDTNND